MYDLIGDIHGHAGPLKRLLQKLGYRETPNAWQHPERKAIFVGDYIDRGPAIRETLQIVKSMTDAGHAIAVMAITNIMPLPMRIKNRMDNTYANTMTYITSNIQLRWTHLKIIPVNGMNISYGLRPCHCILKQNVCVRFTPAGMMLTFNG